MLNNFCLFFKGLFCIEKLLYKHIVELLPNDHAKNVMALKDYLLDHQIPTALFSNSSDVLLDEVIKNIQSSQSISHFCNCLDALASLLPNKKILLIVTFLLLAGMNNIKCRHIFVIYKKCI